MDTVLLDTLWKEHAQAVAVSKAAFNEYMSSLAPPRTARRNTASKIAEAAYSSAKATECELMKKITNTL